MLDFRIAKDEASIERIVEAISVHINPWSVDNSEGIVSLTSGVIATTETRTDLERAHSRGEEQTKTFIQERVADKSKSFHATISQNRLKTFVVGKSKAKSTKMSSSTDRNTFARLVVVAQSRDIDMKTILSYQLSDVPAAISSADGQSIAKTTKSALLSFLEDKCQDVIACNFQNASPAVVIFDAMALIQAFPRSKIPGTFAELADNLLDNMISLAEKFSAKRIDFVGDQYFPQSIKGLERQRRGAEAYVERTIYSGTQATPKQWTKFLSSATNKTSLQLFLASYWAETSKRSMDIDLYVGVDMTCKRISLSTTTGPIVQDVPELHSDHEEADTRMLLHAAHAHGKGFKTIVINSPDTDVAIITLYHAPKLHNSHLGFATGVRNKQLRHCFLIQWQREEDMLFCCYARIILGRIYKTW